MRDAFIRAGHDAWSCDILPGKPGPHIHDDVLNHLECDWDLMIAHPPCTFLCRSGLHWNKRRPGREALSQHALHFVECLLDAPIDRIALENPIGRISTAIRKPDQIIQPYQFGHDASKATCLWLKGLPQLSSTQIVDPRIVDGMKRWANQTDSGQNRMSETPQRAALRSVTYEGIASAMAAQWG